MKQYKNIWPIKHYNNPKLIDSRYSITREYTSEKKYCAVLRFCDEFVGVYKTHKEAMKAAKEHQENMNK